MEIICIFMHLGPCIGMRVYGPEKACDSATGVPIYGNHLHIHPGPCIGMGVWGLREPATVRQVCPYMETICIYTQVYICIGMRVWGLREPATVRQECPNMEIICIYTQAYVLACGYGA